MQSCCLDYLPSDPADGPQLIAQEDRIERRTAIEQEKIASSCKGTTRSNHRQATTGKKARTVKCSNHFVVDFSLHSQLMDTNAKLADVHSVSAVVIPAYKCYLIMNEWPMHHSNHQSWQKSIMMKIKMKLNTFDHAPFSY